MKGSRHFVDYRLSRTASGLFIFAIFVLIIAVVILATLYTTGILNSSNSTVNPFSIESASCNSSGVFVSLKSNVDQQVSISSVQLDGINETVSFYPASNAASLYSVAAGGKIELRATGYSCPAFNTLPYVKLTIAFGASVTTTYTFGNNYWDTLLANVGNVSETVK